MSIGQPGISFDRRIDSRIRTLSTSTVSPGEEVSGFLYVPSLNASDPCIDTLRSHIPSNVTQVVQLPAADYDRVALTPWVSAECTLSYLRAASWSRVRAFIFYRPDRLPDWPPAVDDAYWKLDDGDQWKSQYQFPIYAVSGQAGDELMTGLARYSGNMTQVEHGQELARLFDPRGYARVYVNISSSQLRVRYSSPLIVHADIM